MNGIIFYSNTNQSRTVAQYFASKIGWKVYDLNNAEQAREAKNTVFERVVLVFPVYCQNLPDVISAFLPELDARYLTAVATYGGICYGRVLYELQKRYTAGEIIAAAYVPMKHSYLDPKHQTDLDVLYPLILKNRVEGTAEAVVIGKTYKNPFADVAKNLRSRMIVSVDFDARKCVGCGKCERECLFGGIKGHKTNGKCIRCLKCVTDCSAAALSFRNSLLLRAYLKKKPIKEAVIYV